MSNLVQVDDETWIDPLTVGGVQHWPENFNVALKKLIKDNTTIYRTNGKYTVSYWPFERVCAALGLIDKSWIYKLWEQTNEDEEAK